MTTKSRIQNLILPPFFIMCNNLIENREGKYLIITNNKKRRQYITCDIQYGPGGSSVLFYTTQKKRKKQSVVSCISLSNLICPIKTAATHTHTHTHSLVFPTPKNAVLSASPSVSVLLRFCNCSPFPIILRPPSTCNFIKLKKNKKVA